MTDSLALALRVGFSLAFVLGLIWLTAKVLRGRAGGRASGLVEVLARQQVGRTSTVTVVRVGDRALVLGVTEAQVTLLADTELPELPEPQAAPVSMAKIPAQRRRSTPAQADSGALAGSVLSPSTWRSTLAFLQERTVRRG